MKARWFAITSCVVVILVFAWLVTCGSWDLAGSESDVNSFADLYYDVHAGGLLEGRLDVPRSAIGLEAFIHEEKYYGYFGVVPALLRMPFLWLPPLTGGGLNRAMLLSACVINVLFVYLITREVRRLLLPDTEVSGVEKVACAVFLVVAGLGSTNIFLASRPFVYHEAIMWGATFALCCYYFFLRYLNRQHVGYLSAACVFSCLSFHARASVGAGTLLCLVLFAASVLVLTNRRLSGLARRTRVLAIIQFCGVREAPGIRLHAALALLSVGLTVSLLVLMAYAKFDTPDPMPLQLYISFDPERSESVEGKLFRLSNLLGVSYNLFSPSKIELSQYFPWVYMSSEFTFLAGEKVDCVSEYASITSSKPALLVLSLIGLGSALLRPKTENLRLPLLASLAAGSSILILVAVAERYVHDYYPFAILAGAMGLFTILSWRRRIRLVACVILFPLALFSVHTNMAFALVYQREQLGSQGFADKWTWEKTVEFRNWCRRIDRVVCGEGASLSAVAVADFNRDGKLDLAVTDSANDTVSVLLGNGDGSFRSAGQFRTGSTPVAVAVGDFNNDGLPDIVTANAKGGSVSVLLGTGSGGLETCRNHPVGARLSSLAVGDFDGDGKLDLAVTDSDNDTVRILLGNGDGSFRDAGRYSTGAWPTAVLVGDFNRDGKLDLAVACYGTSNHFDAWNGGVTIYLGSGDGVFQQAHDYRGDQGVRGAPVAMAGGDLNNDGMVDLIFVSWSWGNPGGRVLCGNGDGSFRLDKDVYLLGSRCSGVVVGDLNGDGIADLAVTNSMSLGGSPRGSVSILLGKGDATFALERRFSVGARTTALAAGDFNGDGILDLAVVGCSGVSICLGTGDGSSPFTVTHAALGPD